MKKSNMGCGLCKTSTTGGTSGSISKPVICIVGSTGYVGKCLTPTFLNALKDQKLSEVRIFTSPEKANSSEQIKSYEASGAKIIPLNLTDKTEVLAALLGVHVVVSTLGTHHEGVAQIMSTLLQAMEKAKVPVYFPSEFGTSHYNVSYNHPVFDGKRSHFKEAEERGLKAVRMFIGLIMESSFGSWFGLDCVSGVWTIVGNGAEVPCAITSEKDIGPFTLEAALLACENVSECPDQFEVYSDLRTLREYKKVLEDVSHREIRIKERPMDDFKEEYEKSHEFEKLLMILFSEGAHDYTKSNGNDMLNPNESKWKLRKMDDYAKEVNGVPWL